ncbi:MAG TPA: hypothetical protein VI916_01475 [Acidimicrobiia bacterium]|nr:hypothetical protein [Acidimicrobiia bacterium]
MQLGSKGATYVAVGIAALGFLVIFLGWNGAASKGFTDQQIPYIISGGFAGLGFVFTGLALGLAEARKRDTARLGAKLDRLLEHLGAEVGSQEDFPTVTDRIGNFRRSRAKRAS